MSAAGARRASPRAVYLLFGLSVVFLVALLAWRGTERRVPGVAVALTQRVAAPEAGRLESVSAAEGQPVEAGQPLAHLRPPTPALEGAAAPEALVLRAPSAGVLRELVPVGTTVAGGQVIAEVAEPMASRVLAYLPPTENPASVHAGTMRVSTAAGEVCEVSAVEGAVAEVQPLPPQLSALTAQRHGAPLTLALTAGCELIAGQAVWVSLAR